MTSSTTLIHDWVPMIFRSILFMTALSVGLGAGLCLADAGKHQKPPAPTPQAPIRPIGSTTMPTKPPPKPRLSVTVNKTAELTSYRGWPFVIEASITHPSAMRIGQRPPSVPPLIVAAPSSWADLFQLEVKGESGTVSTWPAALLQRPSSSLTLDMKHAGELLWTLSPAEASKLASGQYRIAAVLASGDSPPEGAWKGTVRSPAVLLTLLDEPDPMSLDLKEQKMMTFSDFHLVRGEVDEAARVIAAHLAEDPESIDGLAMSGELAVLRGHIPEAVRLYERAIAVHSKRFPRSPEPPVALYSRLRQFQEQLPPRPLPYPFEYKK